MHDFTSKELYISNGGQKIYIYKDGFMNVYKATPEEEAEWDKEIIANALVKMEKETNRSLLQSAIADLAYHKYLPLEEMLFRYVRDPNPARQVVFAATLWKRIGWRESFNVIIKNLKDKRQEAINDVFLGLNELKDHEGARAFLVDCLQGSDDELVEYAIRTVEMWAWGGVPALKVGHLLADLKAEDRYHPSFTAAVDTVKKILNVT